MYAGDLKHRVTVQRPKADAPRNASNERNLRDSDCWETLGNQQRPRRAKVQPLSGSERVTAYTVEASRTHTVILRYDAVTVLINSVCRLLWHVGSTTRILAVQTADDLDGDHEWIKCNCIEVLT